MAQRDPARPPAEHERMWGKEAALRGELEAVRQNLERYADALAKIAGVL